jgi:hypothetical protein
MASQEGDHHGKSDWNDDSFRNGDWSAVVEALRHWRLPLTRVRKHIGKHRHEKASQTDLERLAHDATSRAIAAAEPAVYEGRFRSRDEANAFLESFAFGRAVGGGRGLNHFGGQK